MTIREFKEHVKTRKLLDTEEIHQFMDIMSNEARRITFQLNTTFHTPNEVRELLSELFGYRVPSSFRVKLFSTNYTILSEMVVTDRKENNITAIPYKAAFKQNHVFSDKVDNFTSDNFWGGYNIIEPTESLEHAVNKLKKQQKQ